MATTLKNGETARAAKTAVHAHERKMHKGQPRTKIRISKRSGKRR